MLDFALSVVAAAAVAFTLGLVWYSPFGFGDAWVEAMGRQREAYGSSARAMVGSAVALVASATALGALIRGIGIVSVAGGAWLGLLAGVLVAAAMLSDHLFWGLPLRVFAVQAPFRIAYLVLMGVVLAAW